MNFGEFDELDIRLSNILKITSWPWVSTVNIRKILQIPIQLHCIYFFCQIIKSSGKLIYPQFRENFFHIMREEENRKRVEKVVEEEEGVKVERNCWSFLFIGKFFYSLSYTFPSNYVQMWINVVFIK